jgi:hypothetical protein
MRQLMASLVNALNRNLRGRLRCGLIAICALALASGAMPAHADNHQLKNEIRAAFIYNIARFVNWPKDAGFAQPGNINFCLYRASFLGSAVATIAGKPLHQRNVQFSEIGSLAESSHCHALLIPGPELKTFQLEAAAHPPTSALTIADLSSGTHRHRAHKGIMVTLIRKGANLGFEINLDAMQRGGFKASSELLKLAIIVVEEAP